MTNSQPGSKTEDGKKLVQRKTKTGQEMAIRHASGTLGSALTAVGTAGVGFAVVVLVSGLALAAVAALALSQSVRADDFTLDVSRGVIDGHSGVLKFGRNEAVSTIEEDIWSPGGIYPFPTAAEAVRVKAGGNAADNARGSGAHAVMIEGLDQNWTEASEAVTLAGSRAGATTQTRFIRVFRAYVTDVGTYGGNNIGNIDIESTTSLNTLCRIAAGVGQSQMAIYTIPAGKTGYLKRLHLVTESSANGNFRIWQRKNADDVTAPFSGKRLVFATDNLNRLFQVEYTHYMSFPAKTDIWVSGSVRGGNKTSMAASFDLILVDN